MADARPGRHDPEPVEGLLRPAQQLVALDVALVLDVDVGGEGRRQARGLGDHRVVDDELDRDERVDARRDLPPSPPGRRAWRPGRPPPGTPVKSCMSTRSGVKAISVEELGSPLPGGPPIRPPPRCRRRGRGARPRAEGGSREGPSWRRGAGPRRIGPSGRRAGGPQSSGRRRRGWRGSRSCQTRTRRGPCAHSARPGSAPASPARPAGPALGRPERRAWRGGAPRRRRAAVSATLRRDRRPPPRACPPPRSGRRSARGAGGEGNPVQRGTRSRVHPVENRRTDVLGPQHTAGDRRRARLAPGRGPRPAPGQGRPRPDPELVDGSRAGAHHVEIGGRVGVAPSGVAHVGRRQLSAEPPELGGVEEIAGLLLADDEHPRGVEDHHRRRAEVTVIGVVLGPVGGGEELQLGERR